MYLGLTGLVALMVGGIGVAVSVNAFVRQKLASIAILKCARRGAGGRCSPRTCCRPRCSGWAAACSARSWAARSSPLLAPTLTRLLPIELTLSFSLRAVLRGLAMGVGVTLLYALWPLLQIRYVPPALILRREVEPRLRGRRPWAAALPLAAGLAALALWQAGSWKIGALFAGGLAAALILLALGARLVIALARRVRWRSPAWRQGAANLHRPGSHAGPVLVSLGLAVMLVVSIALLDRSLRAQLVDRAARQRPRVLLHRHPDRSGRALRAARGGQRRDRARGADAGRALAPRRGQRRARSRRTSARDARTRGTSRASTC